MIYQDDDENLGDVPSDASDHDEREEGLATEKHWDQESDDPMARAAQHLAEFDADDVPLSDEDWEKEERQDDTVPDHVDAAVDDSLEDMVEEELANERVDHQE